MCKEYGDIGQPIYQCIHSKAYMWYQERIRKKVHALIPKFQLCCGNGKVQLPLLKEPPPLLHHFLTNIDCQQSKNYQQNIRTYNMMFSFT